MRAPAVVRWPGAHQAGHGQEPTCSPSLDWLPTLVDIAGGPKGDGLKKRIEAGQYPGIVKTTLDGVDQRDYLEGKSDKSARDYLLLLLGRDAVGGALQELEDVLRDRARDRRRASSPGSPDPLRSRHGKHQARSVRDGGGRREKGDFWIGGALAGPVTAYIYDWNMLPIGQQLWLKELETYKEFPPLQDPASYNLDQVMEQLKKVTTHPSQ